ncbi:MAG TPA: hypothetical protein VLD58_06565, partial [Gemmatimonadales bacterium]|nr:hypothetical protein [Gemmatimonadales bacterium]
AAPEEIRAQDERIRSELDQALAACIDEPFPDASTALTGVYAAPSSAPVEWYRTLPQAGDTGRHAALPPDRLP